MTTDQTTPTVIDPIGQGDDDTPPPDPTAVPAILGDRLSFSPAAMRTELTEQVRRFVTETREQRGAVQVPADAYPLMRVLAGGAESLKHYGRVIRDLEMEVRGHAEDEALEVVGEAPRSTPTTKSWNGSGVPAENAVIPDADGDWQITRDWTSEIDADLHSLISVQARLTAAHVTAGQVAGVDGTDAFEDAEQERRDEEVYAICQQAAEDALDRLLFLVSKPEPKVTALKAWAKELSRKGLDELGSIVSTAWTSRRAYRGVSVKRS